MNNKNSELDRTIEEVRSELRSILIRRQELILKLGWAFEKVVASKEIICEEIKNCLKEEITLGIISPRTIEQSCPPEWKKKTKPKQENENFSFSHRKSVQGQRKIILDNRGKPAQDNIEKNPIFDVDFGQDAKATSTQDNELLRRQQSIIRELIYENRRLRQETDELQVKLGEAIESMHLLKQQWVESTATRPDLLREVIETEFSVDYRPLQSHMREIYKSPTRQEVWFTVKIDVNKQKVVSFQIGRKLMSQNVMEAGNNE